jgi:hypothetical protein
MKKNLIIALLVASLLATVYVESAQASSVYYRLADPVGTPKGDVTVTVYTNTTGSWQPMASSSSKVEIKYDQTTQPNQAKTSSEKYRNPSSTATILDHVSNLGLDFHTSTAYIYLKLDWPNGITTYYPTNPTSVQSYNGDKGRIETAYYASGHKPVFDVAANTYVIKVSDMLNTGSSPSHNHPLLIYGPIVNSVPEVPFGTFAASAALIAAFSAMLVIRRRKSNPKAQHQ